jgi:hypothetical protein
VTFKLCDHSAPELKDPAEKGQAPLNVDLLSAAKCGWKMALGASIASNCTRIYKDLLTRRHQKRLLYCFVASPAAPDTSQNKQHVKEPIYPFKTPTKMAQTSLIFNQRKSSQIVVQFFAASAVAFKQRRHVALQSEHL